MTIWRIHYEIQGECQWEKCTLYLESDALPTAEQQVKAVVETEHISDADPMAQYNELEGEYDNGGDNFLLTDTEPIAPQRFMEVWRDGQRTKVGLRHADHVLATIDSACSYSIAWLLARLGYIVKYCIASVGIGQSLVRG